MMFALRRSGRLPARQFKNSRKCIATQNVAMEAEAARDTEYCTEPEYPPIKDLSFKARKAREAMSFHDQIKNTPTIEEKLLKINMPRYYGYKVVGLGDHKLPYNCLPAIQHYTRTVLEDFEVAPKDAARQQDDQLVKSATTDQLDSFVQATKADVVKGIEYAHDFFRIEHTNGTHLNPLERERALTQLLVEQINRALINGLAADFAHLQCVEVDYEPRHEAFWFVGGINPPKNVIKSKEGHEWQKEMAHDPVNRQLQYIAKPYLALRHPKQLAAWKSAAESENLTLAKQIPRYNYDPRTLGYVTDYQHGRNIPGYWPSSRNTFGTISFQSRAHMLSRPASYGAADYKEALDAQGILSSYAWLLAQANYNGFNTFSELTYPMNTQTIITNGRDWSFYEYQLNTLLVHSEHVDENPRMNFCRGTGEMHLYQEVSAAGKCVDFNDEVLRQLIKFYINPPTVERTKAELRPYLDAETQRIADYANEDQREYLERVFKHMTANRPRHLAIPEIYLWEKLYKIDNKTRSMEARRRFFELKINPWKRTLDQHQKVYIPKALRPGGRKNRNKWEATHYP